MRLNSKLTWGLAWAGLALVIAVPSVDMFSGQPTAAPAVLTTDMDPVKVADNPATAEGPKVAAVTPTAPKPGSITINPDGTIIRPGMADSTIPAPTPVAATESEEPPVETETQTASIDESATKVAPIPAPLSDRPVPKPTPPMPPTPPAPPAPTAQPSQPLIIEDETETAELDDGPVPPEGIDDDPAALRAYLQSRGLLAPYGDEEIESPRSVVYLDQPDEEEEGYAEYDPDGFYLSDGPNGRETRRSARSRWLINEEDGSLIFF